MRTSRVKLADEKSVTREVQQDFYLGYLLPERVPFVSDPDIIAVFTAGEWFTHRWSTPKGRGFNGNVQSFARHVYNCHKSKQP